MELRHLRYFQAVAEEKSFSRAARRLRVAQPALSRAVKEVEAFLGVMTLDRSRHHVRLTAAGAVLLSEAATIFERWEEAIQRVRRTAQGEEGELRLGYIGPPTEPFMGRVLQEFRARSPKVTIHLEERTPERVWEMVAKRRLSAGLTRPVLTDRALGLRTLVLREEPLGVAIPSTHPLATLSSIPWLELKNQPLVVLARREGIGLHDAVMSGCRRAGFIPRFSHTPSLIGTVLNYVEAGSGWGVVTDSVIRPSSPLCFLPLTPAAFVPLVLVWHEDEDPPPLQRFRELMINWKNSGKLWEREGERIPS